MSYKYVGNPRRDAFLVLYQAGWADSRIGAALRARWQTVRAWREARGLPSHFSSHSNAMDQGRALELYRSGASDSAIASELGASPSGVLYWRRRNKLAPHGNPRQVGSAERRSILRSLEMGATIIHIAKATGRCKKTIRDLRDSCKSREFPRHDGNKTKLDRRALGDPSITKRIAAALGNDMPLDVRDDARSEMYVAVLSGDLAADLIEKYAAHYRRKAWDMSGHSFATRSLDEQLFEGVTLSDVIEDSHAWEDMEEAAERAYAAH